MARPHLFAQIYGYAVCLIAVVVTLISLNQGSQAAFDLADPMHAKNVWGNDVPATFEEFRAEERGQLAGTSGDLEPDRVLSARDSSTATRLSDTELRRIYDSRRADVLATRRLESMKRLVASLLLLIVAITLFIWHWRWLRRLPDPTVSTP